MTKIYTLTIDKPIATIIGRIRQQETSKACRTAINAHFDCNCEIPPIDFTQCQHGGTLVLKVDIGEYSHNIGVSETLLY